MTKCSKEVREVTFMFYPKYIDALLANDNFFTETVDVEGGSPPEQVTSKTNEHEYRLKTFQRMVGSEKGIFSVYLKIA